MSDSEGTKELSGIARSVDALFSSAGAKVADVADSDTESERDAEPPPDVPVQAPEVEVQAPEVELPARDVEDPAQEVELSAQDAATSSDEAAEVEPDAAPRDVESSSEMELSLVDDLALEADDPPSSAEPPGALAVPPEPVPVADIAPSSPLDAAVDAYLAGDTGQAREIERLANEMLEGREVDGVARAVGRLSGAAGDPPDEGVLEVARAIATPTVYGRLARQMGAERDEERRKAHFVACRNLGEPMAVAIRDDLADSTDRLARRIHCEALVEMGAPGRKIIEEMAVDENRFLVRNAVAILGDTGGDRAVELVTSALANPDAKVRKEALRSLAKLGDEESGELVQGMLEDPDPEVRIAAAVAAGELHVERALRSLIKMLDATSDPDEAVPLIRALGQLGDPGAVTSIEKHAVPKLFSKPRTDVRIVACRALNQIGTPHARRLLNQALDDKDGEVKAAVKEILGMR